MWVRMKELEILPDFDFLTTGGFHVLQSHRINGSESVLSVDVLQPCHKKLTAVYLPTDSLKVMNVYFCFAYNIDEQRLM